MKKVYLFITMFLVVLLANGQKLPFQGKLIESGTPVNGTRSISVSIPDIGWSETHDNVSVTDGLYFIVLGSTNPIPANIFSGVDERQMEISVNGTPLSPVTLYKPLSGDLSQLNVKGPGNGLIQGGFGTGSAVNENLPSLHMKGNLNESRLSLNVVGNSEGTSESAYINLNSTSGSLINLSPGWSTFSSTADGHSLYLANQGMYIHKEKTLGQIVAQNWGNKGFSGIINLSGPNSMNVQLGSRFWDNADLPWFDLRGTSGQGILQFFSTIDENESGIINILSKNGRSGWLTTTFLGLNSNGIRTASLETQEYGESKQKGVIILEDTDGNKSSFTPHHLTVNGPDWKEYVLIKGTNEGDNSHGGSILLTGLDDYKATFNSKELLLRKPDWGISASLVNNNGAGELELRGSNTRNFVIGSTHWENLDKPWFNMNGKDNQVKITMTTIGDGIEERGIMTITNNNGEETTYANNGTWGTIPFNMWSGAMVNGTLTVHGDINGSGTNNYNSDKRLKKDIQPLGGSNLNKIESLGGYSYFWKKEEFPEKNFSADQQIGLIAQELEVQFPALVKTGDDGFKSVNYNGFTVVLLLAVKELNQKVEALEKENRLLKDELVTATTSQKEMNELKSQIEALAKLVQIKIDSAGDTQSAENVSTNGLK